MNNDAFFLRIYFVEYQVFFYNKYTKMSLPE